MNPFQDVFISYGRADSKHFAKTLYDRLVAKGFKVWFDFKDIPLGVDYQKQIDDGIEKADNFLFIIAPHSINSPYCRLEIDLALKRNKRIIPLLHVEEISYDTWQQRNPQGTEADWDAYKADGKHSSFPNMHPEIGKINWVYCREGVDDFEQSLVGLLDIVARHQDYVHQHTVLLAQALTWEANQRQARYLLAPAERQQAEAWLQTRFNESQPPCEPTVLQCEFITESIKQANGGMTEAFLSYASEDKAFTERVRQTLIREGLTVWTNYTDLTTGEAFLSAINQGIEDTDNLIYILSPASIASAYCQQEIEYALSLNKRIIPLLLNPVDWDSLPDYLQSFQYIQYIDFRQWNGEPTAFESGDPAVSQLFNILKQDALYYHRHKRLLHQALKWQRQGHSSNVLLRGNLLRQFEAWLKIAGGPSSTAALPVQAEFIAASRAQPEDSAVDVFIAYDDTDAEFASKLNDALQDQGKSTWFDQENVDSGQDYQAELNHGIEQADNVLFIVSPDATESAVCTHLLDYAQSLGKRMIPVLLHPVASTHWPPAIAGLKGIDFQQHQSDFYEHYSELVRTLDSDRDHVRGHTKWLNRAMEWQAQAQPSDMLLRGNELAVAETWLQTALDHLKHPLPTDLQKAFVDTSRQAVEAAEKAEKARQEKMLHLQQERAQEAEARLAAEKRGARVQKYFLGAVSVGFAIACGLSLSTWIEYHHALRNQIAATAKSSAALFASNRKLKAVVEAIRAKRQLTALRGHHPELDSMVEEVLQQAIYGVRAINHLVGHEDWVVAVGFSPNGELLASGSKDGVIRLWQANGKLLHTLDGHDRGVWGLAFSPDSQQLVSGGADNKVRLWNADGSLVRVLDGHEAIVASVAYSPDGSIIASASVDKTVRLWSPEGEPVNTFKGHGGYVVSVAFSPDNQLLAAASTDGLITLWTLTGEAVAVLEGHAGPVWNVAFSPDGQEIASVSADSTIKLWNLQGELLQTLEGHRDDVEGIDFSPDGTLLVSGGADHTVRLWRRDGTPISILRGHEDWVWSVNISPDGRTIASGGGDNRVALWRLSDLFKTLEGHSTEVWDAAYSPDGQLIASAVGDGSVWLWEKDGGLRNKIEAHTGGIEQATFSPDGQTLASASWDNTVKLWDLDGNLLQTLEGHENWVLGVKFSADGQLLASSSEDGTVRLWKPTGEAVAVIGEGESYGPADGITFSPDEQHIAVGYEDQTVRIWDLAGNLVTELVGHEGAVYGVAFSPEGDLIASAGADHTIRLWTPSGELLQTLEGHEDWVWRVAFSPDGQMLASASNDRTVRLWQRDGTPLKTLRGHQQAVEGIQFSPDGKTLASASWDTRVIVWDLEESLQIDPLAYGCRWIQDYLAHSNATDEGDRQLCEGLE
ncbi:MAG: TIR domain-containing protein [Leptolyngbya sp. SIO1E4]|nr:TIR domain-containing protein [Leptolyngbya sp. SIO1E4]